MPAWVVALVEALKLVPVAAAEIRKAKAEGERLSGAALVAKMHETFSRSKEDPGLPPEVRAP